MTVLVFARLLELLLLWIFVVGFTAWLFFRYRRYAAAERELKSIFDAKVSGVSPEWLKAHGPGKPFKPDALFLLNDDDLAQLRTPRAPMDRWLGSVKLSELDSQRAADYEAMAKYRMEKMKDRSTVVLMVPTPIFTLGALPLLVKFARSPHPGLWVTMLLALVILVILISLTLGLHFRRVASESEEQAKAFAKRKEDARAKESAAKAPTFAPPSNNWKDHCWQLQKVIPFKRFFFRRR
jgi:hypothetical protein